MLLLALLPHTSLRHANIWQRRNLSKESPVLTPPPDDEAEVERSRFLEGQARRDLEAEGCPPCYPIDLEFPLQKTPEKYQGIISYWESLPATGDVVLRAQLSDWKRFRKFQERNRRHYSQKKTLGDFEDKVRERRRRHKVEGDICLRSEPGQQSRLENWIEFQDYHLQCHEKIEESIDELKTKLDKARKESEDADAARDAQIYEERLESAKGRLEQHKVLLRWIEQERMVLDAEHAKSVEEDHDDQDGVPKAVRRASALDRRERQPKAHSVLGPVQAGISKLKPRKRNMQRRKGKVQGAQPTVVDLGAPRSSISRIPDGRENRLRRTTSKKERPLRPFQPQKVSKVKRPADANAKSPSAARLHGVGQKRSKQQRSPQRPQSAPVVVVKTRSGRESRKPERWFPGR